ncbi:MAG: hypothetical protein PHO37_10440 [Kiritimatiellae bacterium]|nr:hypothetical protein [Kiritimatiellia bacterium]
MSDWKSDLRYSRTKGAPLSLYKLINPGMIALPAAGILLLAKESGLSGSRLGCEFRNQHRRDACATLKHRHPATYIDFNYI